MFSLETRRNKDTCDGMIHAESRWRYEDRVGEHPVHETIIASLTSLLSIHGRYGLPPSSASAPFLMGGPEPRVTSFRCAGLMKCEERRTSDIWDNHTIVYYSLVGI